MGQGLGDPPVTESENQQTVTSGNCSRYGKQVKPESGISPPAALAVKHPRRMHTGFGAGWSWFSVETRPPGASR